MMDPEIWGVKLGFSIKSFQQRRCARMFVALVFPGDMNFDRGHVRQRLDVPSLVGGLMLCKGIMKSLLCF